MKNNFLIESNDYVAISSKIDNIIKDIKSKDIIKYDLSITSFDTVLEDLNTYNFLSDCKVIICYNTFFLSPGEFPELKKLKKYLENPSDNYLILVTDSLSTKKEVKDLLKYLDVIDGRISSEILIKKNLDNFTMDNRTVRYLSSYCLGDNEKILNELQKIKCYKLNDEKKEITINDIDNLVIKNYDENVFDLVNAIVRRDKPLSFDILSRILQKQKDSVTIVASIASQIRLLYSIKTLKEDKVRESEMSSILGVKQGDISIASQNCDNFSSKKLLYLIDELAKIDLKSKSENIDSELLLKKFIFDI